MPSAEESKVLLLTGAPGSGKTTVSRLLAARFERAVHLESDRFFHFIESGYVEPWRPESHEQNTVVMSVVAQAAASFARAGYLTIVDGIISPGWFLEPLRDTLHSAGEAVSYAVLRAPLDVCLQRAASRVTDRLSDPEVIEQLWGDFADLGRLEAHAIDSSAGSAEQIADLLAGRLSAGALVL